MAKSHSRSHHKKVTCDTFVLKTFFHKKWFFLQEFEKDSVYYKQTTGKMPNPYFMKCLITRDLIYVISCIQNYVDT